MSSRILVMIATLSLTACSERFFEIIPAGSLDSGVYFEFGNFDGSRTENRIVSFQVIQIYELARGASHEVTWSLEGRASVDEIRYGFPPDNLVEQQSAVALQPMRVYQVQALEDPRGLKYTLGWGIMAFYISESGVPILCGSIDRCSEALRGAA